MMNEQVIQLYQEQNQNAVQISEQLGIPPHKVRKILAGAGIQMKRGRRPGVSVSSEEREARRARINSETIQRKIRELISKYGADMVADSYNAAVEEMESVSNGG